MPNAVKKVCRTPVCVLLGLFASFLYPPSVEDFILYLPSLPRCGKLKFVATLNGGSFCILSTSVNLLSSSSKIWIGGRTFFSIAVMQLTKVTICDRLWENLAKVARQNSEKKGKSFSKDAPLIHFIHPKVQKYIQKCLTITPNIIKINSIPI
jgi:hypothetical protein